MTTAILAVYRGSRDEASLGLLEAGLAQAFPGFPVFRAFLSHQFPEVPTLEQALLNLSGYDQILVQPMLVAPGPAYEEILQRCIGCAIGTPLLAHRDFLTALRRRFSGPLLLMLHGAPGLKLVLPSLPQDTYLAALRGSPTLSSVLPALSGQTVRLIPLLLTAGCHLHRDLALWQAQLERSGCIPVLHRQPLAHWPEIPQLFGALLQEAANSSNGEN